MSAAAQAPTPETAESPSTPEAQETSETREVLDSPEQWHRVHPLSPLIRGWLAVLAILGIVASNGIEQFFGGPGDGGPNLTEQVEHLPGWASFLQGLALWLVILVAVVVAALLTAVVVGLFSLFVWWCTRFQVTPTHVRLRQGAIFRQERQTRLDRVQAIDIQRPLGARIFGLAELRFEVADAGESSVVLRYLRHDAARELRSELLGAIGDPAPAVSPDQDPTGRGRAAPWAQPATALAEDEDFVLQVPHGRAMAARMLSGEFIALVLVGIAAITTALLVPEAIAPALAGWLGSVIALASMLVRKVEGSWSFRAARTSKGLRLRYGLLNATSQTVPTGRIQALSVCRPLLWRPFGWSEVKINVAGYGGLETGDTSSRTVLIPVATDEHLRLMLIEAVGEDSAHELTDTVLHGLTGDLVGDPQRRFTLSPHRAARISWIVRRRRGFAVTPREVVTVDGRLTRRCSIVPHGKIQSLRISRGPIRRWLDLSDVWLHSIAGPVHPVVACVDRETAEQFVAEQTLRSREAHVLV